MVSVPSGGGRIVHLRSGDELELSAADAKVLELTGKGGLGATDPLIAEVVARYQALGVLVQASPTMVPPPPAAASPSVPEVASAVGPEDPVPCLRPALQVTAKRGSSSLVNVSDLETGKSFQLYDFEATLARMLDGRRSHAEVVRSAQRIGLPVTFDSLVRFIRELKRYGFLSPTGTVAAGQPDASIWPERESWDEATRALYQSGLRMHRQGRYHESAAYFEAMLAQDPKNVEALEMLQQAKQRAPEPPVAKVSPLPNVANRPIEHFDELSLDDAPAAPAPVASPAPARGSRVRTLLAVAVGLASVGLGWNFLLPLIERSRVPAPSAPEVVLAPAVQDAGAKAEVPDAAVEVAAVEVAAVEVDAGVEVAETALDAGAEVAEVLDAGGRDWQEFEISRRARVKMGEVVAPSAGILSWKVTPDQRVKRGELVATLQTSAATTRLVAPVQGLVIRRVAEGEAATAGQAVADILYHEAYLQTVVTGRAPSAKWGCEVVDEGQRADCTVGVVVPRGAGFFVTAIVLPRWFDGATKARLRLAAP